MTTRDFLETPQGIVFVSVWVYLRAHMCLSVYRNIWSLINHCHYPRILALYLLHANTSTISPSLALSLFFPWGVFIFGTWCSLTAFTHCLHGIKDERGTHIHTNTQQHTHTDIVMERMLLYVKEYWVSLTLTFTDSPRVLRTCQLHLCKLTSGQTQCNTKWSFQKAQCITTTVTMQCNSAQYETSPYV